MNRCHVCGGVAVNADAALRLTCSAASDIVEDECGMEVV